MKSISTPTPFGETIFCDDIREESRNKISIMGVYSGVLIIDKPFPTELAKFSMLVTYHERPGESTSPVELVVTIPGDAPDKPFFKGTLPIDKLRQATPDPKIAQEDIYLSIRNVFNIANFSLKEEGYIRVRAYRDDLEIRMGSIFVTSKPPETPPTEKPEKAKRKKKSAKKKATKKASSK